mmetsp:Transcript_2432/g.5170  ORF Transcript_2432/g.5170 Transcript_2432/m.5170 type:complete len:251 (-) Transcript_2432:4-756(-)
MTTRREVSALLILSLIAFVCGGSDNNDASRRSSPRTNRLRGNNGEDEQQRRPVVPIEYGNENDANTDTYEYIDIGGPIEDAIISNRLLKKDEKDGSGGTTTTILQDAQEESRQVIISGGTIDLRGTSTGSSPTGPPSCMEVRPLMGCDRGGGDDQIMTFFGANFGTCSNADPCLFALMPTRMAYYCPTYARPACGGGGRCYSIDADCPASGQFYDKDGTMWERQDPRFAEAERSAWGYWPGNFGCPSCMH